MMADNRRSILAAAAVMVGLLASSAPASAKAYVERGGFMARFSPRASNGYDVEVKARGNGRVVLTASKFTERGTLVAATYRTEGEVTDSRIAAGFGKLGRISVSLDRVFETRSGPGLFPPWFCNGQDPVVREGTWRGQIVFRGEGGYTKAIATHAEGRAVRSSRQVCGLGRGTGGDSDGRTRRADVFEKTAIVLRAVQRANGRKILFDGFLEEGTTLGFQAEARERREGLAIHRIAATFAAGPKRSFVIAPQGEQPRWARVAPGSPFKGAAEFRQGTGAGPTWAGSLRVLFPGLGMTALTGPGFVPFFCETAENAVDLECD